MNSSHHSQSSTSGSEFHLRDLKESFGTPRTNDDVHRSIQLCPLTMAVLDTPHMQRLRGLKQLGVSEMTYVPTTHSRFEHSLGVAALAEKVLREISRKQPNLNITEKDIVCVKLAGLLHDIGHGPYSHVYDGTFRKQLMKAEEEGSWLGETFDKKLYHGLPEVMDGWEHEDGSLMMIDALLKHLGLEIDESRLDEPLRQIGDGIRANTFGIHEFVTHEMNGNGSGHGHGNGHHGNGFSNSSYKHDNGAEVRTNPLTSRDWIFIKECVVAGPLPPKGMSVDTAKKTKTFSQKPQLIGRPSIYKEFLYDVVANRHSGLDVDKMDYLARDGRRAFGTSGEIDPMFIENAYVAWGNVNCKNVDNDHMDIKISSSSSPAVNGVGDANIISEKNRRGQHLMICYPEKMVQNAMNFFKSRFANHQKLYTHHSTSAACFMVCDIMLLADQHFRLPTREEGDGTSKRKDGDDELMGNDLSASVSSPTLPISRANVHPNSYLLLKDSVIDLIAATTKKELRPARKLINRFRSHKLYKKVAEQPIVSKNGRDVDIPWQRELWGKEDTEIAMEIFKCFELQKGNGAQLQLEDIIVEKRSIHHGMKENNPVSAMRFLPKSQLSKLREAPENLPVAVQIDEETYECSIPRAFLQRTLRIYCRKFDRDVCDLLITCYYNFINYVQKKTNSNDVLGVRMQEGGDWDDPGQGVPNCLTQSPNYCSNDGFAVGLSNNSHLSNNEGGDRDDSTQGRRKRRKPLFSSLDLDKHIDSD